jgi:hypothetical protein
VQRIEWIEACTFQTLGAMRLGAFRNYNFVRESQQSLCILPPLRIRISVDFYL